MSRTQLLSAYRRLYKATLKAIRYSTPARYQVRDIIRHAFRNEPAESFNPLRVRNTMKFLRQADKTNGLEHKILKNILISSYWRTNYRRAERKAPWLRENDQQSIEIRRNLYSHLDATVIMLNETMELCLRSNPAKLEEQQQQYEYRNDDIIGPLPFAIKKIPTRAPLKSMKKSNA